MHAYVGWVERVKHQHQVIRLAGPQYRLERRWYLRGSFYLLAGTIAGDLIFSAVLPAHAWHQIQPEIQTIRTYIFNVTWVIIGHYFGSSERRGDA
jgi:hypothetical protein